ncbi:MAG: cytochrome b/b6 domain-containing protein [Rhizobiales bacterium]|nr:cytochrome b/b6 domain-containing protein [Hyphomicrobiales bacterium]
MTSPYVQRYARPAIALHWAIALAILAGAVLGLSLEAIPREQRLPWANLHAVLGTLILLLTLARLYVRATHIPPPLYDRDWVIALSKVGHVALYALTLALPVSGLVMWWLRGRGLDLWAFQIPSPLAVNRDAAKLAEEAHEIVFWIGALAVGGHVLAALVHQFVWKDRLLERMRPA